MALLNNYILASYDIPADEVAEIRTYFRHEGVLPVQQEPPKVSIASPAPAASWSLPDYAGSSLQRAAR